MPADVGSELAHLLGPYWSATRTAEELGLSQPEMRQRLADRTLLWVTFAGTPFFPIWQFHRTPDGGVEVKPGLLTFIKTLSTVTSDGWTIGTYLRTPAPELTDLTPEQWVDEGRSGSTLDRYAAVVVRQWGRR